MKQRFIARLPGGSGLDASIRSLASRPNGLNGRQIRNAAWNYAPTPFYPSKRITLCEGLEDRRYFAVSTDAAGWTVVTPSSDSRIVYVSTSGNDLNTGFAVDQPVATFAKARTLLRTGFPDQMLLRRGDTFSGQTLSVWNISGRSPSEPIVIGAYTDPAAPTSTRPKINTGIASGFSGANKPTAPVNNVYIMGVAFEANNRNYRQPNGNFTTASRVDAQGGSYGVNVTGTFNNLLIEDCSFQYYRTNLAIQAASGTISNVSIRRNQILDAYVANVDKFGITLGPASNATSEGIYTEGIVGLTIDGNTIDHNGWTDNNALGAIASIYNHNLYINAGNSNVSVINNIISDASSHGLQMRAGGIVKNNLFLRNPIGMSFGYVNGTAKPGGVSGEISGNVFLEDRDIAGQTRGYSLEMANLKAVSQGGGTLVKNNIFAADTQRSFATIRLDTPSADAASIPQQVGINDLTLDSNLVYSWYRGIFINPQYSMGISGINGINNLVVKNNDIQRQFAGAIVEHGPAYNSAFETWTNNRYDSSLAESSSVKWFRVGNVQTSAAAWQSTYEPTAQLATGLFPDPTRGVAKYNAGLGGDNSTDAFIAETRRQSKAFWRTSYTPDPVVDFIRAGFSGGRIDLAAPTASATTQNVTVAGGTSQIITATYGDDNKIDLASLGNGDLRVVGPNGFSAPATLVSSTGNLEGVARVVTYIFTPPSGAWSAAANGAYQIVLQPGELLDSSGRATPSATIGTFSVAIDPSVPSAVAVAAPVLTDNGNATVNVTYTGQSTPSLPTSVSPLNAGFEAPNVGANEVSAFQVAPADGAWTYTGTAGITGNGSDITSLDPANPNPPAPQGAQTAFITNFSTLSQSIANWQAGTYTISFRAAQRSGNNAPSQLEISVDNLVVATIQPDDINYKQYTSATFTVPAGVHSVAFAGAASSDGAGSTALIDDVQIVGNTLVTQQSISAATLDAGDIQLAGPKSYSASPISAVADVSADGTQRVVTYTFAAPAGGWSSVGNGTYAINSIAGQVATTSAAAVPAGRIGSLAVAVNAPGVTVQAGDVNAGSSNAQGFTLTFAGANPVSVASLDSNDLRITGPGGFNLPATFVGVNDGDGTAANPLIATYTVAAPAAGWTAAGNGVYYVNAIAGQIVDVNNNPVPAGVIGTFKVAIDNTPPVSWTLLTDITAPTALGGTPGSKSIGISLYDPSGINLDSLDNADVRIIGPNGYDQPTVKGFVANSSTATYVTYSLVAPAGGWKSTYNGVYSVQIQPGQIFDKAGNALSAPKEVTTFNVTLETTQPTVSLTAVSPATRSTPVISVNFSFSEVTLNVDPSDFTLTLNGSPISTAGATITTTDNINYTLGGLSGLTGSAGSYTLSLVPAGITDLAGNIPSSGASTSWTTDLTAPTATATAPNITLVTSGQTITVAYTDNSSINTATLDGNDILVTGPGGYSSLATFSSVSGSGGTRTAIYTLAKPAGGWKVSNNGEFTIRLQPSQVADNAGNFAATAAIGTFTVSVETTPPTASATAPAITSASSANQTITVNYADNVAVDATTIGAGDLTVTGPAGYSSAASLVSVTANGTGQTAIYSIPAPVGGWRGAVNGTYSISLNAGQIADTTGNLASAAVIGSFGVSVETNPPTASATAPAITAFSLASQTITVAYADNVAVNGATIDSNDVLVTGPNGYSSSASLVSMTPAGAGYSAVYSIPSPTGGWTVAANGVYAINLIAGQVADTGGNVAAGGVIGSFNVALPVTAPTLVITPVSPSPRATPVDSVSITFSEPVTGFDLTDLSLTREGIPVALTGATLSSADGASYVLGNLTSFTGVTGTYSLTVSANGTGITNASSLALAAGATSSFLVAPVVNAGLANPGFEATNVGAGNFGTITDGSWTFNTSNQVSNNGSVYTGTNPNAPEGQQVAVIQAWTAMTQAVGGLAAGPYKISFQMAERSTDTASQQVDVRIDGVSVGTFTPASTTYAAYSTSVFNIAAGTHTVSFVGLNATADVTAFVDDIHLDAVLPLPTAQVTQVASPRNMPVEALAVTFSRAVSGFDLADLSLTRNGSPVSLDGVSIATTDNVIYNISGLAAATATPGAYVFKLTSASSGITALDGQSLVADVTSSWSASAAPAIASITPSPVAGSPFLQNLTINGSDFAADATVVLRNLTTGAVISGPTVVLQSSTQLVVKSLLGTSASNWTAEVTGSTGTSTPVGFSVDAQTPIAVAVTVGTTGNTAVLSALNAVGVGLTFNWSTTSAPTGAPAVTFSVNGSTSAGTTATFGQAGSYVMKVRISDGVTSVDTSVTVDVAQKLTSIVPSPTAITVANSKTQQFTVIASDQFAKAMAVTPPITWSIVSGIGTISSAGLYTAPATGSGKTVFQAASAGIVGQGNITIPAGFTLWVDFTTATASVDTGYLRDSGLTYASRGNGYTYGWNTSHTASAIDRNKTVNQLVDTNIGVKTSGKWEALVANGKYTVVIGVGDSGAASTNTVRVEGTSAFSAVKLAANAFSTKTLTVTVTDGKLTIDNSTAANLATRLTYLKITKA